jgi:hypothetical protein
MIKLYLISIVIWAIMIFGACYIFEDKIREKGWLDAPKSKKNPLVLLFFMSAIPVLRVLFFLSVLVMASLTKEQVDEWTKDSKDESN